MPKNTKHQSEKTAANKARVLKYLAKNGGNVSAAARSAKVGESTIYGWRKDKAFAEELKRLTDIQLRKDQFVKELELNKGFLQGAADIVGISSATLYRWREEDEDFDSEIRDAVNRRIDFVEGKQFELIDGVKVQKKVGDDEIVYQRPPDQRAIQFFLSTQGRERGYQVNKEVKQTGSLPGYISEIKIVTGEGVDKYLKDNESSEPEGD